MRGFLTRHANEHAEPSAMTSLRVLHEDDALIAVDKPAGVLSHPNPGRSNERCSFSGGYDRDERRFEHQGQSIWLIHRLDRDSSGVLLAAKRQETAARLRDLFEAHEIEKTYLALVLGLPRQQLATWKDHLETHKKGGQVRSRVRPGGAPNAELTYRVSERFEDLGIALLEIDLKTGRTHQIRVQCARRRHPVLGDRIYGNFETNKRFRRSLGLSRLFLHASALEFPHPDTGHPIRIESPLPDELQPVLAEARESR